MYTNHTRNVLYVSWSWLISMSTYELYRVSPSSYYLYDWERSYYNNPRLSSYRTNDSYISWLSDEVIESRISDTSIMVARDAYSLNGMLDEVTSDDDSLYIVYLSPILPAEVIENLEYSSISSLRWISHDSRVDIDEMPSWVSTSDDPNSASLPLKWDILYINRDDMVSPPHLDSEFTKFCHDVMYRGIFSMSAFQEGVFDNRWDNIVFDQYQC